MYKKNIVFLLGIISILLFVMCGRNKKTAVHKIDTALFVDKIRVMKDVTIRDKVSLKSGAKIIGSAVSNEVFKVVDVLPRALKIYQYEERQGWIFVYGRTNYYKATGKDTVFILKNMIIYENTDKKNNLGLARNGAEYRVLNIEAMYYKIRLDNGQEGWIYAGKHDTPWVSELNITNFRNTSTINISKSKINFSNDIVEGGNTVSKVGDNKKNADKGLILWNTMDSMKDLKHSIIGPGFDYINGVKEFGQVKFNNGVEFQYSGGSGCAVLTPIDIGDMSKGTIEFWYLSNTEEPDRDAMYLTALYDSKTFSFPLDICMGLYWAEGYNNNYGLEASIIVGNKIAKIMTGKPGDAKIKFLPATPTHIAYVWDINGIKNSGDTMRLYKDGKVIARGKQYYEKWEALSNAKNVQIWGPGDNRPSWATAPNGKIDNLKIYNYAKTDFSDRFGK